LIFVLAIVCSCGHGNRVRHDTDESPVSKYDEAINTCILNLFGKLYEKEYNCIPSEISIPLYDIIALDDTNIQDIQATGDFWLFYYDLSGDTLKTVTGFNKPGKLHMWKMGNDKYSWSQFEFVSMENEKNAQRVFGDKLEEFLALHADSDRREAIRAEAIAAYVRSNGLSVKYYQNEGQPAVKLPPVK